MRTGDKIPSSGPIEDAVVEHKEVTALVSRRVMAGRCGACLFVGSMELSCPCDASAFTMTDSALTDGMATTCERCHHPFSSHDGAPPRVDNSSKEDEIISSTASQLDQWAENPLTSRIDHRGALSTKSSTPVDNDLGPRTCLRDSTVQGIIRVLDEKIVCHVRGTPSSGKSVLARLLSRQMRALNRRVVLTFGFKVFDDVPDMESYIVSLFIKAGYTDLTVRNLYRTDATLLIDEAQSTYRNVILWNNIIKTISGDDSCAFKICLFSSYSSPFVGTEETSSAFTPVHFGTSQLVSLLVPLPDGYAPNISLFFSQTEFSDVVARFLVTRMDKFLRFDDDMLQYMYDVTLGHPAAVTAMLDYCFIVRHTYYTVLGPLCPSTKLIYGPAVVQNCLSSS